ncbi:MAG: hypothetical protein KAU50_02570 [Candidatus Marinimicrobia bacterium]|nr:hypothetical protein [Candidatus Neomarinimicrobiota bacterium]
MKRACATAGASQGQWKTLIFIGLELVFLTALVAHDPIHHLEKTAADFAQQVTLDWKVHDVGKIRQVVTNTGGINAATGTYDRLFDYHGLINCEYPVNSNEEHIFEAGIRIGAVVQKDTLVSITNWNNAHLNYEFYPGAAPDDTIWVARKGDTLDIPYWPGYVGVSDQDFICKYSDHHITNITLHTPLYVDVIQTSYAWSSFPFDNVIVYNYYIIPTRYNLEHTYVTYMLQGRIGDLMAGLEATDIDDKGIYIPEHRMLVISDEPGGADGTAVSPIAAKIYPPESLAGSLVWTVQNYLHHHETPMQDIASYLEQMTSGVIMKDQDTGGQSIFSLSFGPMNLVVGDTVHFVVVQILGDGMDEIMRTAERSNILIEKDFRLPTAPPKPALKTESKSHEVILNWRPEEGETNPEDYTDPNRGDNIEYPFEGYRVYKSTGSITGPWTLLAEFDLPGNDLGFDTGLEYEYTDVGLLDNLEYYYSATAYCQPDFVLDFPSLESSINANAMRLVPGPQPPETVGKVAVVPNPYRGDVDYNAYNPKWEKNPPGRSWMEQDRRIQFINLPANCEIRIYTLAGDLIKVLRHNDPNLGYEDWNLTSTPGQAISSGIYLYVVNDTRTDEVQVGKFVVIK